MRKGVTGKILTTIICLVTGLIALTLIWLFLTKSTTIINLGVEKIIAGVRCKIFCKQIVLGLKVGMCTGC